MYGCSKNNVRILKQHFSLETTSTGLYVKRQSLIKAVSTLSTLQTGTQELHFRKYERVN